MEHIIINKYHSIKPIDKNHVECYVESNYCNEDCEEYAMQLQEKYENQNKGE